MAKQSGEYLISFRIETAEAKKVIDQYIKFIQSLAKNPKKAASFKGAQTRRNKSGKAPSQRDELIDIALKKYLSKGYIKKLQNIKKEVKFTPGSRINKIVKDAKDKILENIEARMDESFNTHKRYSAAMADPDFAKITHGKTYIQADIVSTRIMDQYTDIAISRFGPYDPPDDYNYTSWWRWHEYDGGVADKSKDWRDYRTYKDYWFVRRPPLDLWPGPMFKGFNELRNVFTVSNKLFSEDEVTRHDIMADIQFVFAKATK